MPETTYLPAEVLDSIRDHVQRVIAANVEQFASAGESEDTMTGQFFGSLQVTNVSVRVENSEVGGTWRWSAAYTKFRSGGGEATEEYLGADGIVELQINHSSRQIRKAALFQAKMYGKGGEPLLKQCLKLSTWHEAAFVISYEPTGFTAARIDDVIANRGRLPKDTERLDFAAFFVDEFVACKIGDADLFYNAAARRLYWRTMQRERVAAQFALPNRLRVRVRAPTRRHRNEPRADRMLSPAEVYDHRMLAAPADILGLGVLPNAEEIEKAWRRQARAYHPDPYGKYGERYRELATRRMSEINHARDELKKQYPVKK